MCWFGILCFITTDSYYGSPKTPPHTPNICYSVVLSSNRQIFPSILMDTEFSWDNFVLHKFSLDYCCLVQDRVTTKSILKNTHPNLVIKQDLNHSHSLTLGFYFSPSPFVPCCIRHSCPLWTVLKWQIYFYLFLSLLT